MSQSFHQPIYRSAVPFGQANFGIGKLGIRLRLGLAVLVLAQGCCAAMTGAVLRASVPAGAFAAASADQAGDSAGAVQSQTPLLASKDRNDARQRSHIQWKTMAAREALDSGFHEMAIRLFRETLAFPGLQESERKQAIMGIATACLNQRNVSEARATLAAYPDPDDPAYLLRIAYIAYLSDQFDKARELTDRLRNRQLPPEEQAWYWLLYGIMLEKEGFSQEANQYYAKARQSAPTAQILTRFETIIMRNKLLSGDANENIVADLKTKLRDMQNQRGGFEAARLLAIALSQLGRQGEATTLIEEQLPFAAIEDPGQHQQLLLLLGLISGEDSARGRLAFQRLLQTDAPPRLQRSALYLLARDALDTASGERDNEFTTFLDRLISSRPNHPLRDEIFNYRARLYLEAGQLGQAEAYAQRILDEFPGSPLTTNAIRLLAYLAWRHEPPQYRTAADYLNRLRSAIPSGFERLQAGILMADCYFLNGDYENAASAYGALLAEDPGEFHGSLVFQQCISLIRSDRLEQARTQLDSLPQTGPEMFAGRWQAEWNLALAMKHKGMIDASIARVTELLGAGNPTMQFHLVPARPADGAVSREPEESPAPDPLSSATSSPGGSPPGSEIPDQLRLRLLWLKAQLLIEANRPETVPDTVERLLRLAGTMAARTAALDSAGTFTGNDGMADTPAPTAGAEAGAVPGQAAVAPPAAVSSAEAPPSRSDAGLLRPTMHNEVVSHALLLQGQALYMMGQKEEGLAIFQRIRNAFPTLVPAMETYLIEARDHSLDNRLVEAQRGYNELADLYPDSPYAPIALWESALNAERRGLSSSYQEAVILLERLVRDYGSHYLVYYARLKQADLSRKLNDFGTALLLYEGLINQYPEHPERYRAEMSRADCLLAQSSQFIPRLDDAIAIYERLADLNHLPVDLRAEANYKWGYATSRRNADSRAAEIYWLLISAFLKDSANFEKLGPQGRYWLSRGIIELGYLLEEQGETVQALQAFRFILDYNLPGKALARSRMGGSLPAPSGSASPPGETPPASTGSVPQPSVPPASSSSRSATPGQPGAGTEAAAPAGATSPVPREGSTADQAVPDD